MEVLVLLLGVGDRDVECGLLGKARETGLKALGRREREWRMRERMTYDGDVGCHGLGLRGYGNGVGAGRGSEEGEG